MGCATGAGIQTNNTSNKITKLTSSIVEAGLVQDAGEELQPDDGVDDDDEQDQEGDMEQRHHGFEDRVKNDLET